MRKIVIETFLYRSLLLKYYTNFFSNNKVHLSIIGVVHLRYLK